MRKTAYIAPEAEVIVLSDIMETNLDGVSNKGGVGDTLEKGEDQEHGNFSKKFNMWDNWEEDDESFDSWE